MSEPPEGRTVEPRPRRLDRAYAWLTNPAALFAALSLIFGAITIAVTPPLRGPDERAHFVRAYGIATGEIVPATHDAQGRKGIFLPRFLHDELSFYEWARHQTGKEGFSFHTVMPQRLELRAATAASPRDTTPTFFLYDGSEGYSPIPYAPYTLTALVARAGGFDFLATIYLMRALGLVLWTAVIAYAIAAAPILKWAFLAIAMLPSALYARAIVSADGAVLASTLMLTALALKAATGGHVRAATRSFWTAACALAKPPQIAFVLMEAMVALSRGDQRRWRAAALVVGPALILAPLWWIGGTSDAASWRYATESNLPPETFDPVWKAKFVFEHPLHFPTVLLATFANLGEWFWHQLIGVLGWLDVHLRPWVHPIVTALLLASGLEPLGGSRALRMRVFVVSALAASAYILLTLLILFVYITAPADKTIEGLQGRYFVVVLPLFAMMVAALLPRFLPGVAPASAVAAALISGCAVIEALLRVEWP